MGSGPLGMSYACQVLHGVGAHGQRQQEGGEQLTSPAHLGPNSALQNFMASSSGSPMPCSTRTLMVHAELERADTPAGEQRRTLKETRSGSGDACVCGPLCAATACTPPCASHAQRQASLCEERV